MNFIQFREDTYPLGLFSSKQINLMYPGFNNDNLVYWQKKGYIIKIRNGWYCHADFLAVPDHHCLIANNIYSPSYISHQFALNHYGMIPEHILDITSMTTRKTASFSFKGRVLKYYSVKKELFFGYILTEIIVNGMKRNIQMAEKEKALLDMLYSFNFYKTKQDLEYLRLNDYILNTEFDWNKCYQYADRMKVIILENKLKLIQKIYCK